MCWCANDCIVICLPKFFVFVGPQSFHIRRATSLGGLAIPEIDGVRLISKKHEFIRKFP